MPIPSQNEINKPLLEYASQHSIFTMPEAINSLAKYFQLSEAEKKERLKSGSKRFENRVYFARLNLLKAGLIEAIEKKTLKITNLGHEAIISNPTKIDHEYLMKFPGYAKVINEAKEKQKTSSKDTLILESEKTPEEQIENGYQTIQQELSITLLDNIRSVSPTRFEEIVVELLVAMGYGGSIKDAGEAVGQSGDDGIDGVIKEDKLGLDRIYIQAKRYAENNTVGRPAVQSFAGSLEGVRARKGVFITTSKFSREALDYVKRIEKKIILIDGQQLTELMIENNVGVTTVTEYILKKLDQDYFEEK